MSLINLDGWDFWYETAIIQLQMPAGDWGIRANINRTSPNVTYNVYQDGNLIVSNLNNNYYAVHDFNFNQYYEFSITASYPNGITSDFSNTINVQIISDLTQELSWDDNEPESFHNPSLNDLIALPFYSNSQTLEAIKWYQLDTGGAFWLRIYNHPNNLESEPIYEKLLTMTGSEDNINGFNDGWNLYNLSDENISLEGEFFIEFKLFSSSPTFGIDTTINQSKSLVKIDSSLEWETYNGNFMVRALLSCEESGSNCEICGCDNVCSDPANLDDCGVCDGDNALCEDCAGIPNGDSIYDECNICDNNSSNDCVQDCAGVWGGTAILYDACGVCSSIEEFECSECSEGLIMDCLGECGGDAEFDECNICDDNSSNDCVQDCEDVWGGTSTLDICGICNGDNSVCTGCMDEDATNMGANSDALCYYFDENGVLINNDCLWPCFGCCNYTSSNPKDLLIDKFQIENIYPNPFNPITKVEYQLPSSGYIDISIYNIKGNIIFNKNDNKNIGTHIFTWDASNQVSGIYFLVLKFNNSSINRKLLLIK